MLRVTLVQFVSSMHSLPFAKHRMPAIVVGVLLLHALTLWAVQSGLLRSAPWVEPPVLQMSFIAAPPRKPEVEHAPAPIVPPAAQKHAVAPAAVLPRPAAPAVASPSPAPAPVATATPVATALPQAPQGQVVPVAPAGAAIGLAQSGAAPVAAAPVAAPKVELPTVDAEYLHAPKLDYPRMSRKLNEQGRVMVSVYIGVDGLAQKAEVKVSSGFERLDQAALATVRGWRFVPGKRGGVPEAMWFNVPINFVLNE